MDRSKKIREEGEKGRSGRLRKKLMEAAKDGEMGQNI